MEGSLIDSVATCCDSVVTSLHVARRRPGCAVSATPSLLRTSKDRITCRGLPQFPASNLLFAPLFGPLSPGGVSAHERAINTTLSPTIERALISAGWVRQISTMPFWNRGLRRL
uniref:Uncharacterized protein n=1 Tax=Mycena chlorophos TaxID=658473 RepID=A0ABQ0M562_MYCCL|nr:predicted protein [Mycena chlorophos]